MHTLNKIIANNPGYIRDTHTKILDPTKIFGVVELTNGTVYVETVAIDEDGVELTELLISSDKKIFTIIRRERAGDLHHEMKSYPRDTKLPIGSKVKLCRN